MARNKEHMNLATEILNDYAKRLTRCRIALAASLAGNVVMAAVLIFR